MPPVQLPSEDSTAFTILNHEEEKVENTESALPKNVNVVKPLQRDEEIKGDTMDSPSGPQTILDPKFSRALDFKLRRLKEKEILQANLRRPIRYKPRNGLLAASNPNISSKDNTSPSKLISQSHPRIDNLAPDVDKLKVSPKMDKSPSPGRKSRVRKISGSNDGEKPRFVTTVKTGQFLLPPPEVACLLGLETLYPPQERDKIVYSYASKPKAVNARTRRSVQEKKENKENIPNGGIVSGPPKIHVGQVFGGVRALVAGVMGIRHINEKPISGSIATSQYTNMMHDKRVVRGSTFAAHPQAGGDGAESQAARAARTRRRALARKAAAARLRPGTPPPAPGRRHHPIQTEYYLEELFDKGQEMEVGVQTDLFVDRPSTPIYVPAKTGADAHTQIYPGDLFDFDLEVQPILEVLIGKTTEQSLAEVAQEEELATLREQQRRYCELRDAELAERQRLAAQDLRLHQEKERRVAEARIAQIAATEARERAAAAVLVQGYVAELLPSVLAGLRDQGYLLERVERGVDEEFMPWLMKEVSNEVESLITSRDVLTEIVRDVIEARSELYRAAGEREAEYVEPEEPPTPPSVYGEGEEEPLDDVAV
ncbi:radial spoke head protein 3 homolog isoform X1 [Plodia interpunctella]|uniref:radial spoke head protein 3 homolog isoform X1 n=1 Tax=Plodia interpunctella TaxID=58824 RepID=UPI002367F017|nr:radial spoke head protein 3 homolog isoform X1 [Plodia interpunctella]